MDLSKIIDYFIKKENAKRLQENITTYEANYENAESCFDLNNTDYIYQFLNMSLSNNDQIILTIKDSLDIAKFSNNLKNITEFMTDVNKLDITELWNVELKINKNNLKIDNYMKINLYDLNLFFNENTKNFHMYLINMFSKLIKNQKYNLYFFNLINDSFSFFSSSFIFSNLDNTIHNLISNYEIKDRDLIINERINNCNIVTDTQIQLVPSDFKLIELSQNNKINAIFNEISYFLSLMYISNSTRFIDDNNIVVKLNGYKSIIESIVFSEVSNKNNDSFTLFYEIFDWIYDKAKVGDRMEIARNIISLHVITDENKYLSIEKNTFKSIKSSYKIYLKENTDKYILTLNNVSNSLFDMRLKADNIVQELFSNFKNNFLAFFTLFITIILSKALSVNADTTNIITFDIALITTILGFISIGICIGSNFVLRKKINWLKNNLEDLKIRYNKILNTEESENIFTKFNIQDSYINTTIKIYNCLWVGSIFLIILVIWICERNILSYDIIVHFFKSLITIK